MVTFSRSLASSQSDAERVIGTVDVDSLEVLGNICCSRFNAFADVYMCILLVAKIFFLHGLLQQYTETVCSIDADLG